MERRGDLGAREDRPQIVLQHVLVVGDKDELAQELEHHRAIYKKRYSTIEGEVLPPSFGAL